MKEFTTELRNEVMEEYKKLLSSQTIDGDANGFKLNIANITLDVLKIFIEKANEK